MFAGLFPSKGCSEAPQAQFAKHEKHPDLFFLCCTSWICLPQHHNNYHVLRQATARKHANLQLKKVSEQVFESSEFRAI